MANYHGDYSFLMNNHYCEQPESIAKAIDKLMLGKRTKVITFVDVGSHEGKLTGLILENLTKRYSSINTHCVEPDKETFNLLRAKLSKKDVMLYNSAFQGWLRDHVQKLSEDVDLLLNAHTFYHYPKSIWTDLIRAANKLLAKSGHHVIVIDSDSSSLNEIKPILDDKIPQKRHDAFGEFLTGSKLEDHFKAMKIKYVKKAVPAPIYFKNSPNALNRVCKMLGFVMRYDPVDVKKYARHEVEAFIEQYRAGDQIIFPRDQDFFSLPQQ